MMNIREIIGLLIFVSISSAGHSQTLKVSNVHFRQSGNTIEIFYDLPVNRNYVEVKLFFQKRSDSTFFYEPKYVSGSVGKGKFSGKNRRIIWYFRKEPPDVFTGSGFYFRIRAVKIDPKVEGR
jgi:hypothetical protein